MAEFKQGSRFIGATPGTFQGNSVLFPRRIDYKAIGFVTSHTIKPGQQFREDLISQDVYLRDDLGWHIMAANKLDSISQLKTGVVLGIPPIIGIIV